MSTEGHDLQKSFQDALEILKTILTAIERRTAGNYNFNQFSWAFRKDFSNATPSERRAIIVEIVEHAREMDRGLQSLKRLRGELRA